MKSADTPKLADATAEKARAAHADCIRELQQQPFVVARVVANVKLEDGKETTVAHGLGRVPTLVFPSAPRGATAAGVVIDLSRDGKNDRAKTLKLKATGYGATITVDIGVA